MTAPGGARRPKVEVVDYTAAHAQLLSEFIAKVWDPGSTVASVIARRTRLAARPGCTDGRLPTVLVIFDGVVVGHLTSLPERVAFRGRVTPISWLVGFHVLPEFRNGPIGMLVAKEMVRIAPQSMCSMVLDAPLRLYTAMGWTHLGTVPNLLRVVNGAAVAGRLDPSQFPGGARFAGPLRVAQRAGVASLGGRLASAIAQGWSMTGPRAPGLTTVATDAERWTAVEDADALWAAEAPRISASVVRDGARLVARFGSDSGRYVVIEARSRAQLVGWLVLRRPRRDGDPRLNGVRVSPIVDLMFPMERPEVIGSLIDAAVRFVRRTDFADALLASTPHSPSLAVLRRSAFLPIAGTLQLVAHPSILPAPAPPLSDWLHARGDGDADESF